MQRLKRHGFRGALILGASRLLVTLVLLAGLYAPGAMENESAKLLVLGAIVGYWLGHGGESDAGWNEEPPSPSRPQHQGDAERQSA